MPTAGYQLDGLQHAYLILDVPTDASALAIKRAYRRLMKRWHPDFRESGTAAHSEATQMTKLINEAYAAISHAPLRYQREGHSRPSTESQSHAAHAEPQAIKPLNTDRIEYWVRFVCGAAAGLLVSFQLLVMTSDVSDSQANWVVLVLGFLGVVLGFGFGAGRYGDKFWHSVFRRWWLWP